MEKFLPFLVQVRMCLDLIGGEFSLKMEMAFLYRIIVVATRLSCKTMCTITANQHNCRFLVHKRNIRNMAEGFALLTVVETNRFIGYNVNTFFNSTCWTKNVSNSLLYFVVHTQLFLSIFG